MNLASGQIYLVITWSDIEEKVKNYLLETVREE